MDTNAMIHSMDANMDAPSVAAFDSDLIDAELKEKCKIF